MQTARAMECCTAYIDLRKGGVIRASRDVVILFEIGRMTLGAHVILNLCGSCPVQRIVGAEFFVNVRRREVEQFLFFGIPR